MRDTQGRLSLSCTLFALCPGIMFEPEKMFWWLREIGSSNNKGNLFVASAYA